MRILITGGTGLIAGRLGEYFINKVFLIEKYQKELIEKFGTYDFSQKILRVEKKNRKCYFFY